MIERILMAYDGSDNSRRALELAAELCGKLGAELTLVHVLMHGRPAKELVRMAEIEHMVEEVHKKHLPDVTYAVGGAYNALSASSPGNRTARVISALGDQLMHRAKARCSELGVSVKNTQVRDGDYADEIIEAAAEAGADMIVLGSRGLGAVKRTVLGSVSQKVLHHAPQTVVAVK